MRFAYDEEIQDEVCWWWGDIKMRFTDDEVGWWWEDIKMRFADGEVGW